METLPRSPTASGIVTRQGGDEARFGSVSLGGARAARAGGGLANRAPVPSFARAKGGMRQPFLDSPIAGPMTWTSPAPTPRFSDEV
jgi:hypothetical protein